MAVKEGEEIDESTGDLFFTSTAKEFRTDLLLSRDITSRTFSFYYPKTRPQKEKKRYAVVSSTNANWSDWADLNEQEYLASKQDLIETTIDALERYLPGVRDDRSRRCCHAANVQSLHSTRTRGEFRHQVRRLGRQSRIAAANRRDVPCGQRRHHHERMAGRDQLRCDR